ncbi:MAG: hypothetical protein EOP05_18480 [Proteobacteria bacterium]|nr:MAG: hypothetical protein EOP05_18480 [Pseudomonadota bacterium]
MARLALLLLILIQSSTSFAESVAILTYNAGLLHRAGVDFVPCVAPRTLYQAKEVFSHPRFRSGKPFVLTLQEVWTEKGFNAYAKAARTFGFSISPMKYSEIKSNGQLNITNLKVLNSEFLPFSKDSHVSRGFRITDLRLGKKSLKVINVHTTYSDSKGYSPLHIEQFTDLAYLLNEELKSFKGDIAVTGDFNAGENLAYIKQSYDPAKLLWTDWLLPMFETRGFQEARAEGNTWDTSNPLVSKPTAVIKLVNTVHYGIANWEEKSARLDHIFVSKNLRVSDSRLVFNKTVDLKRKCAERSDKNGYTHLSDHFGILAEIEQR